MAKLGTHIQEYKSGFGFIGSGIPGKLLYEKIDGSPMTTKDFDAIKHCGPGLFRKTIREVRFPTREAAQKALDDWSLCQ